MASDDVIFFPDTLTLFNESIKSKESERLCSQIGFLTDCRIFTIYMVIRGMENHLHPLSDEEVNRSHVLSKIHNIERPYGFRRSNS